MEGVDIRTHTYCLTRLSRNAQLLAASLMEAWFRVEGLRLEMEGTGFRVESVECGGWVVGMVV